MFGLATYFANSLSGWYALTFEGTLEISMTCLLIFAVLTPIGNTCGPARSQVDLIALEHICNSLHMQCCSTN